MSRSQPDYPLVTARLRLRPFSATDLDAFHAINARDDVARYLYNEPLDRAAAAESLRKRLRRTAFTEEGEGLGLAVERRDSGAMIGEVLLIWTSIAHRTGEIGFVFHPDQYGQGFAREASEAILRVGFAEFGLHRIIGRCAARNDASWRLLARLGMRREAHFVQNEYVKGEWCDEFVYALLAEEWAAQRGAAGAR